MEKRICLRFEVPGAVVNYKIKRLISYPPDFDEDNCPILDLSRGGIRFVCQEKLDIKSKGLFKISVPQEDIEMELLGEVRWVMQNPGISYKYQCGVQFNPYGEKKNYNSRESHDKIITLEEKFVSKELF